MVSDTSFEASSGAPLEASLEPVFESVFESLLDASLETSAETSFETPFETLLEISPVALSETSLEISSPPELHAATSSARPSETIAKRCGDHRHPARAR